MTQAGNDQPEFHYLECRCGFSSVQKADFRGSAECPLCAGDSGLLHIMPRRVAHSTDRPEGKDARKKRAAVSRPDAVPDLVGEVKQP